MTSNRGRFPTDAEFEQAILWLESNEGDESAACRKVARYLEHIAQEHLIKTGARQAGVTTAVFRRRLIELRQRATTSQ
jgi:hypothetical protein